MSNPSSQRAVPHTLEPQGSPVQFFDSAFVALLLALLIAMTMGRHVVVDGPAAGSVAWDQETWRFMHDVAKGLLMPLLLLRTYFGTGGFGKSGLSGHGVRFWVSWAMVLCWVGDLALTRAGSTAFLFGLSAFLLGHFGYIMVFRNLAKAHSMPAVASRRRLVVGLTLLAVVIGLGAMLVPGAGEMAPAVLVYSVVIAAMAFTAWTLDPSMRGVKWLAWGAIIFMSSDMMIAFNKFYAPFWGAQQGVMITYAAAQWMIAQGVYLLMKRD